jgi:hypothetical protein
MLVTRQSNQLSLGNMNRRKLGDLAVEEESVARLIILDRQIELITHEIDVALDRLRRTICRVPILKLQFGLPRCIT